MMRKYLRRRPRIAIMLSTACLVSMVWAIVAVQMVMLGRYIAQDECRDR